MRRWVFILVLLMVGMQSCFKDEEFSDKSNDLFIDEVDPNIQLYDLYVDKYGNEGIIACIYNYGIDDFGYIIAISLDETIEPWGPMDELVYKADFEGTYVFSQASFGLMMLQSMKSMGIHRFPAQKWCDDKNNGEQYPYTGSWRLPSLAEFRSISNINALNQAIEAVGGTPLSDYELYWTCVEDFDNYMTVNNNHEDYDKENRAIPVTPKYTQYTDKDRWIKKNKHHVRAIKYVYFHF